MPRPLLSLMMIVKDEANCIKNTLQSVGGVADRWCILDTGSTDRTMDEVRVAGSERCPAVAIYDHADQSRFYQVDGLFDYAKARNRVLDLEVLCAEAASVWALSLSADEMLHGGDRLRSFLSDYVGEESAFLVEVRTPTGVFDYPRVLKVGGPWVYEGAIHEVPVNQVDRSRVPTIKIPDCRVEYKPSDPDRFAKRLRERDIPLLMKQLSEAIGAKDVTAKARIVTFLAQTREQLSATFQNDIVAASQEMFSAMGWYALLSMDAEVPEEARRLANWKFLNVAEILGVYLPQEMVPRLARVLQEDSKNPAAAYMLARHTADIRPDGKIHGDARAGMQAAQRAAKIAQDAIADPSAPHDPHGLLWRSHFIAACCARALGHKPAAKRSAEAGLAGGGPTEAFQEFMK